MSHILHIKSLTLCQTVRWLRHAISACKAIAGCILIFLGVRTDLFESNASVSEMPANSLAPPSKFAFCGRHAPQPPLKCGWFQSHSSTTFTSPHLLPPRLLEHLLYQHTSLFLNTAKSVRLVDRMRSSHPASSRATFCVLPMSTGQRPISVTSSLPTVRHPLRLTCVDVFDFHS